METSLAAYVGSGTCTLAPTDNTKVEGGDASGLGGPKCDSDPSFGISMKSGIAIGIAIPGFIVVSNVSIMSFLY